MITETFILAEISSQISVESFRHNQNFRDHRPNRRCAGACVISGISGAQGASAHAARPAMSASHLAEVRVPLLEPGRHGLHLVRAADQRPDLLLLSREPG